MVNGAVQLPDGWTWQIVDELSENIQYGYTESANDEPVGPKFLRITDIQNGKVNWDTVPYCECSDDDLDRYLLESGDIVFARTGATTGKSFLITNPPKAVFASYLIRLRLKEAINEKYFSYFLDSPYYWLQIMQVRKGSAQPGVNANILAKLKVPVAPLPEQERIVAKIEELVTQFDAGTSALERVRAGLRRYKASVLKAAVEGRLVNGNSETEQGGLPEGWRWTSIADVGAKVKHAIVDGPFGSMLKTSDYVVDGDIPVITISNIDEGFEKNKLRFITKEKYETIKRSSVSPGDIIVAKIGSSYGKVGFYPDWMPVGIIPANLLKITVDEQIDKYYVFYYLQSSGFKKELDQITKSTAQPAFNVSMFRELPIPLPPLEEQRRIVAEVERRLSVAWQVENTVEEALVRASRLRQAVLKSAFEGRL